MIDDDLDFVMADMGAWEVAEQFVCANEEITNEKYRCLYEFDEYVLTLGCRDMSHLANCGELRGVIWVMSL